MNDFLEKSDDSLDDIRNKKNLMNLEFEKILNRLELKLKKGLIEEQIKGRAMKREYKK